jgi:YD repeat-containing protein
VAQQTLENYVQNGGGFIATQWDGYEMQIGHQVNMPDLILQGWDGATNTESDSRLQTNITYTTVAGQQGHPVLAGLPYSFTFFADGHDASHLVNFPRQPSTVLMTAPHGGPAVIVRNYGIGKVVNFSAAPDDTELSNVQRTLLDQNIQKLYVNAVAWVTGNTTSTLPTNRLPGTRLEVGAGAGADGAQVTVAPNTGALQIYQPLDMRLNHDPSRDGFIDLNGNPLQGMTSGDNRLLNQPDLPVSASSGIRGFGALVYSSDTVHVRPILEVEAKFDPSLGVPTSLQGQLTWNNETPQPWRTFSTTGHAAGDTYLLGDQVTDPVSQSGDYPWQMDVHAQFADGTTDDQFISGTAIVTANDHGPFGPGWTFDGLNKLVIQTDGILMVYGSGEASRFFAKDAATSGAYSSPPDDFGTLTAGGPGYVYRSKYGIIWDYNSQGLLLDITDPHNLAITFSYDASGLPLSMTLPDGSVTAFGYTGALVTSIGESGGRSLSLIQGTDLTGITDVDGTQRSFGYDSHHHLTALTWAPTSSVYTYDPATEVVTAIDRGQGTVYNLRPSNIVALQSIAANATDAVADFTDPRLNTSIYTLDVGGWVTNLMTQDGAIRHWQREPSEQVTKYTDADGHATTYNYSGIGPNGMNELIKVVHPDGGEIWYTYDSTLHRLIQEERRLTHNSPWEVTNYLYDSGGQGDLIERVVDQSSVGLNYTTFYSWADALLISETDARGFTTSYKYKDTGTRQLDTITDAQLPVHGQTVFSYDASGFLATLQDPMLHVTTKQYDARGRLTEETAVDGGVTTRAYNVSVRPTASRSRDRP